MRRTSEASSRKRDRTGPSLTRRCAGWAACGAAAWIPMAATFVLVLLILIFGGPLEQWAIGVLDPHPRDKPPPP